MDTFLKMLGHAYKMDTFKKNMLGCAYKMDTIFKMLGRA